MAVKCNKIVKFLEETAPLHLAEEWDNCGLIIGNPDQDIEKVLVCLDATHDVIIEAVEKGVDMIISHHPVIFKGVKRINRGVPDGEKIYELIKNDISVYCAHTNLDIAEGGTNDYLAGLLGLSSVCNLKSSKLENNEREYGLGRVGVLSQPVLLSEFAMHVKNVLNAENIKVIGDAKKAVKTVAVSTGSFDGDFDAIKAKKADVIVTGDVKYHTALEALGEGISMIDAGHFETERVMVPWIAQLIGRRFPQVEIMASKVEKSPYNYH